MDDRDLRLDGNAVAGLLAEVLAVEPTTSMASCAGCGTSNQMGALMAYMHGMGAVLRCPGCDAVMLRLGHTPAHIWLDLRGLSWLRMEAG
jgi:Family of unknown function (DUF6510)